MLLDFLFICGKLGKGDSKILWIGFEERREELASSNATIATVFEYENSFRLWYIHPLIIVIMR